MREKSVDNMRNRPPTAFESYERDIAVKGLVTPREAPVLKMQGKATVESEDVSEDVLRRSMLKFYSLHITDFPREETVYLVGDEPEDLVTELAKLWPEYSVEFCIGTIWRNDNGTVVGQLVEGETNEDLYPGEWLISGSDLAVPGEDRAIKVPE